MKMSNCVLKAALLMWGALSSPALLAELIKNERHFKAVNIVTSPSTAIIYLNGKKLGESPLSIEIERLTDLSNQITALPMFAHQFRQDLSLSKGSLPEQVKIFMDIDTRDRNQGADDEPKENEEQTSKEMVACSGNHQMQRLYFNTDDYRISEAQKLYLKELACHLLNKENTPKLRVYGHADLRGSSAYNIDLSLKRALSVKEFLTQSGYPAELIATFAYGETQLRGHNKAALPLQENRRIHFEVLYAEHDKNSAASGEPAH